MDENVDVKMSKRWNKDGWTVDPDFAYHLDAWEAEVDGWFKTYAYLTTNGIGAAQDADNPVYLSDDKVKRLIRYDRIETASRDLQLNIAREYFRRTDPVVKADLVIRNAGFQTYFDPGKRFVEVWLTRRNLTLMDRDDIERALTSEGLAVSREENFDKAVQYGKFASVQGRRAARLFIK